TIYIPLPEGSSIQSSVGALFRWIGRFFTRNPAALGPAAAIEQRLQELAEETSGPFTHVYTKLTQLPALGRDLYTAVGPRAMELADQARKAGDIYEALIPTKLINELISLGYANQGTLSMGNVVGTQLYFFPSAIPYIQEFFQIVEFQ